jgi:hypothetical protein
MQHAIIILAELRVGERGGSKLFDRQIVIDTIEHVRAEEFEPRMQNPRPS